MVKCIVSGCPNREVPLNRKTFNRSPKKFFSFPKDPARVKVWLAALRETDRQDVTAQHLICEDHFLPEDIFLNAVHAEAIPLMPPCPDGRLGMINPWGVESSEEEDQFANDSCDEDDDDEGEDDAHPVVEPPAPDPPQQDWDSMETFGAKTTRFILHQEAETSQTRREDVSLVRLVPRLLDLLLAAPDGSLNVTQAAASLKTCTRRVYDVTNVLFGVRLIEKQPHKRVKWTGQCPISSFRWRNPDEFRRDLENLRLVEETLDTLIKSCSQQLFDETNDTENSAKAYVTLEDLSQLEVFQEQAVIVVKAPEETKLEVHASEEAMFQVRMKGGSGPIAVLTCDPGTREKSGCFVSMEESHIRTATLHTGLEFGHSVAS